MASNAELYDKVNQLTNNKRITNLSKVAKINPTELIAIQPIQEHIMAKLPSPRGRFENTPEAQK